MRIKPKSVWLWFNERGLWSMTRFDTVAEFHDWVHQYVRKGIKKAVERSDDCWFEVDDDGAINISYEYVVACLPDFKEPIEAVEMLYSFMRIGCHDMRFQESMEFITDGVVPLDHKALVEVVIFLRSHFACECVEIYAAYFLSYWNRCVEELRK